MTKTAHHSDSVCETVYTGTEKNGLELRVECRRYTDFAAAEYLAFFTNRGEGDSLLFENILIADGVLPLEDAVLYHGNGDTMHPNGYEWYTDDSRL